MSLEPIDSLLNIDLDCFAPLAMTSSESGTLALSEVSFHYPSRELSCSSHSLLQQISFTVPPAGILHIQGQNGSGKTSLLKLLAGLLRPDSGVISYADTDIWSNMTAYQNNICYLGHKNGIHPNLTVWEQAQESSQSLPVESLEQCLKHLNLWALRDRLCGTLSAGQKRRMALLRILVSPAKLWLLDEPLIALDAEGIDFLMACLQRHMVNQGQVIYTSHHALPWCAPAQQEYRL